jgi:hypothetical protein
MLVPRYILRIAIVIINIFRLICSLLLFRQLFYFRIPDVAALYIGYLLLDALEGIIVFYDHGVWRLTQNILYHFNHTVHIFAVVAGLMLYAPLAYFLLELGISVHQLQALKVWLICSVIIFILVLIFGYATAESWGNIQNLAARLSFLVYCTFHIPPWVNIFSIIAAASLIGIEIAKYGWSWRELCKKDIRFRHSKPNTPP